MIPIHRVVVVQVGCELTDDLILSEVIFDNQLVDLEPSEFAALLSALCTKPRGIEPHINEKLEEALDRLVCDCCV
jgi:superfamily II RNA helicase